MIEKSGKILIAIAIVVAGVLIAGAVVFVNQQKVASPEILSPQQAGEKAINFINENLLSGETTASLVSIVEESGVYKFRLKIEDQEYTSYVTKDGKLLFPEEGVSLESALVQAQEEETAGETSKSDKPDVKLFVMSYCPYGLQAQKMFLPVYDLLKEKAEMGVYFVNYIMHEKQEIDENLRQYCIQKEEKENYYNYLNCFVKDGDFEECLSEVNIDKNKMNSCISQTDQTYKVTESYNDKSTWLNGYYPKFDVHKDLNDKYGIQGSPAVVINDSVIVQNQQYCPGGNIECTVIPDFERTPEKFKEVICQAFNTPPDECSQALSEEAFSPGFGLDTGSSSSGSCQ